MSRIDYALSNHTLTTLEARHGDYENQPTHPRTPSTPSTQATKDTHTPDINEPKNSQVLELTFPRLRFHDIRQASPAIASASAITGASPCRLRSAQSLLGHGHHARMQPGSAKPPNSDRHPFQRRLDGD
ncbi:uncharacterized protein N7459_009944 [Penicillium hispanicum]|uniref:uncharacterized protein n=1 Tax=Penicillium hispanicum TaxID=1080232 RepID=UPI002540585C|nr:uncharacterized protein N7459_009944 [Penicillium hispanicum]KAJ5570514.1 hypothetical protein N7459_009944 [Penicillium hispanicum]